MHRRPALRSVVPLTCLHPWRMVEANAGWLLWPNPVCRRSLIVSTLVGRVGLALDGSRGRSGSAPNVLPAVSCGWWEVVPFFIPPGVNGVTSFVDAAHVSECRTAWLKKPTLGQTSSPSTIPYGRSRPMMRRRPLHAPPWHGGGAWQLVNYIKEQ